MVCAKNGILCENRPSNLVYRIEIQDAIFDDLHSERIIEIGPGDTLANMARKTYSSQYAAADTACGFSREIYSCLKDINSVYYKVDSVQEDAVEIAEGPGRNDLHPYPKVHESAPPVDKAGIRTTSREQDQSPTVRIPDVPTSACKLIQTLVAVKLKKQPSEIPLSSTIQALAKGISSNLH
jgi:hypothetical protein